MNDSKLLYEWQKNSKSDLLTSKDHFHTQPLLVADFLYQCSLLFNWHTHTSTNAATVGEYWPCASNAVSLQPGWRDPLLQREWSPTAGALQENTQGPTLWKREPHTPSCQWDISSHWLCSNNTCSRFCEGKGLLVPLTVCVHWCRVCKAWAAVSNSFSMGDELQAYGGIAGLTMKWSKPWVHRSYGCKRWGEIVACQGCDVL